jgi:2-C-methyl-D-erythritol 4-phosphate cytidylyltransferase
MATFGVILAAAGRSSRFGTATYKKPFAPLAGRAVWMHSAERFLERSDVRQVVIVVAPEDRESFVESFGANLAFMGITLAEGGDERVESVRRGMEKLQPEIDHVAIHDAARPCLAADWIESVFAAAVKHGAAILATPVVSTLKRVGDDMRIKGSVDRTGLWEAQTPQVFRRDLLERAYAMVRQDGGEPATDESILVERSGHPVVVVRGSPVNLKITTHEDLRLAEKALEALPRPRLSGPAHPFADD